ncbi:Response regulator with CheY-like receiver, AAA-type ATPase, and DNA-binding domains [Syntrophobacter sp. SbD1]|nr:Response regulator with CheY-like receiver, AAA-type ATPase, and DNA-binding domains [Syntrophobacter sp. SbD1]
MSGFRVIVIDDERIVGQMIKASMEPDGYNVETFLNAEPAFARLREEKFDVVITDLKMKGIDGMDVLRTIKTAYPEVKVIMITAFASLDSAVEAMKSKVDGFFAKPVKIKDLKECIYKLLNPVDAGAA